jgi:polar amino acid transport system substrate-binding protein
LGVAVARKAAAAAIAVLFAAMGFGVNSALAYQAARNGHLKPVGTVSSGWPLAAEVGITTRRGSGLAAPFTAAINAVIADGRYARALSRWSLGEEAVDVAQTNPPGLPKF